MTKSTVLTIPEVQKGVRDVIAPTCEAMGLIGRNEELLYGFHGYTWSKASYLAAAYARFEAMQAASGGKGIDRFQFYTINLKLVVPAEFDDVRHLMSKRLDRSNLERVPFVSAKSIDIESAETLGDLWQDWASEYYGKEEVNRIAGRSDVDWRQVMSFMPAFPAVAGRLFEVFPKLRCAIIPMYYTTTENKKDFCWVGVLPKARASEFVTEATVTMKDLRVDLSFT
jgi:hypothetical protein